MNKRGLKVKKLWTERLLDRHQFSKKEINSVIGSIQAITLSRLVPLGTNCRLHSATQENLAVRISFYCARYSHATGFGDCRSRCRTHRPCCCYVGLLSLVNATLSAQIYASVSEIAPNGQRGFNVRSLT